MELQEFLDYMNAGKRVIAGSEVHQFMNHEIDPEHRKDLHPAPEKAYEMGKNI